MVLTCRAKRIRLLLKQCQIFKKPSWFQWSWFPKDGQPPTQSILELVTFVAVLLFCKSCFVDFNRIPHYNLSIEANKLSDFRSVNKANYNDSTFYLHYQIADLKLTVPMVSPEYEDFFEPGVFSGIVRDDSISIYCKQVYTSTPFSIAEPNQLLLKSEINPYWHAVYDIAARQSGFHPVPSRILSDKDYNRSFYDIRDNYLRNMRSNSGIDTKIKKVKKAIPDSLSGIMQNYYFFRISSNILYTKIGRESVGSTDVRLEHPFEHVFIDEKGNSLFDIWQTSSRVIGKDTLLNHENEYIELYHANNYTKKLTNDYKRQCVIHNRNISYRNDTIGVKFQCYNPNNHEKSSKRHLAIERPSWADRHDISRGWYKIFLKTCTIDSLTLTIDFVGATDFYPMRIEPDEKGSNYIKFYDPQKILKIRKDGLTFYAQFKDLENMQTIRCFFVSAIISGLLIALLSSVIIGIYRGLKAIGRYSLSKKE